MPKAKGQKVQYNIQEYNLMIDTFFLWFFVFCIFAMLIAKFVLKPLNGIQGRFCSRCIYIRVGDILLPTFFVFGVRDKCNRQNVRDNFCSSGFTLMVCIGHVQNQNDGCIITQVLC